MKESANQSNHYYFQMYPIYPSKDNTYRKQVKAEEIAFEDIPDDVKPERQVPDNDTYLTEYEAEVNFDENSAELLEETDGHIGENTYNMDDNEQNLTQ